MDSIYRLIKESYFELGERWEKYFGITQSALLFVLSLLLLNSPIKYLLMFLLCSFLTFGTTEYFLKALSNKPTFLKIIFKHYPQTIYFAFLQLIKILQIFFWSIFLIIPGITRFIEFSFTTELYCEKPNQDAFNLLEKSKKLTQNNKFKIFFIYLFIVFLTVATFSFSAGMVLLVNLIFPVNNQTIKIAILIIFSVLQGFFVLPYAKILKTKTYFALKEKQTPKRKKNVTAKQ